MTDWYTPQWYVDAARQVLGHIDLDPASDEKANEIVKADRFYTAEDNGLAHPWHGKVWLNPPYQDGLIEQFARKLLAEYRSGRTTAAVALLDGGATEEAWYQALANETLRLCMVRGPVVFWLPGHRTFTPLQGQHFMYFGDDPSRFTSTFSPFGRVWS